jgi:hypothetical protein
MEKTFRLTSKTVEDASGRIERAWDAAPEGLPVVTHRQTNLVSRIREILRAMPLVTVVDYSDEEGHFNVTMIDSFTASPANAAGLVTIKWSKCVAITKPEEIPLTIRALHADAEELRTRTLLMREFAKQQGWRSND